MVAALVERTGHGYQELLGTPYEDVLQMNVDVLAHSRAQKQALDQKTQGRFRR